MDPAPQTIACPYCQTELEVFPNMEESQVKCSGCLARFWLDAQLQPASVPPNLPDSNLQMVRLLHPPSQEPAPVLTQQAERRPDAPRPRLKVMVDPDEGATVGKNYRQRHISPFWKIVAGLLLAILLGLAGLGGWQLWIWFHYGSTGATGLTAPLSVPAARSLPAPAPGTRSAGARTSH